MGPLQLLINGKFEDAAGGKTFETYDPRTGEVLMSVAEAQAEDVDKAVKAAREVWVLLLASVLLTGVSIAACPIALLCDIPDVRAVSPLSPGHMDMCEVGSLLYVVTT